jgi:hypothetical protein
LGLLSTVFLFFTGIPAIILGILGLRDIRRSSGALAGKQLAAVGVGTGLAGTCLGVAVIWFAVDRFLEASARID